MPTRNRDPEDAMQRQTERLVTGPLPAVSSPEGRLLLIERILEDGDTSDLRWLLAQVPEAEIVSWLESRGGRRLSSRSRVFWASVLAQPVPEPRAITELLWPL